MISRRAILRGAGATIGLPSLPSLSARGDGAPPPPARLLAFFVPCGFWMDSWAPRGLGETWELSPTLAALAPHKQKTLVLSGLDNLPAREPEGTGDHACGTAGFLTCRGAKKLPSGAFSLGVSMDQVAARVLGRRTRVRSLQLGVKGDSLICDPGYSCAYINNVSWASATQPLPKTTRPDLAFDELFEVTGARSARTSVLDHVLAESRAVAARLGADDRRKLDEYVTGVREVERRVRLPAPATCRTGARPEASADVPARVRAMLDLIVLAFTCDATRVVSFMMGNGFEGSLDFPFLGITSNHHSISHHQRRAENVERLQTIDAWEVAQLAYLLGRLDAIREGDATLLDRTAVFFSSEIADGNSHSHTDLPVVVAGGGRLGLRGGRHLRYQKRPIADLFLALLHAVGAPVATFGEDGTAPLPDLG
jgi:hypothetical protein